MKHKPKIYFRADGNSKIGLGHVIRSLALAEMLSDHFNCHFIIQEPSLTLKNQIENVCQTLIALPPSNDLKKEAELLITSEVKNEDIMVLDGYHFKTDYQKILKSKTKNIICIDDIHSYHFLANAIINHAGGTLPEEYTAEPNTKFYLGPAFALLRKPFRLAAQSKINRIEKDNVLICFGGADPNNDTLSTLIKCNQLKPEAHFFIIIGSAYQYRNQLVEYLKKVKINAEILSDLDAEAMVQYMNKCPIAITSPSTIAYEYLSVGGQLYLKVIADNQKQIFQYLIEDNLAYKLEEFPNAAIKAAHLEHQNNLFDGKQDKRFLSLFYHQLLKLRKAGPKDMKLYFDWANEKGTRSQSFNSDPILWDNHQHWFSTRINSDNHIFLIGEIQGRPVGQLRFDMVKNEAIINYSIDEEIRGKGIGKILLEEAMTHVNSEMTSDFNFVGYVKFENIPSAKVFRKFGFSEQIATEYPNTYKYILPCKK